MLSWSLHSPSCGLKLTEIGCLSPMSASTWSIEKKTWEKRKLDYSDPFDGSLTPFQTTFGSHAILHGS